MLKDANLNQVFSDVPVGGIDYFSIALIAVIVIPVVVFLVRKITKRDKDHHNDKN